MLSENKIKNYRKAGQIAQEAVKYAKSLIKKDMLLVEIAEKIESKIVELGGKLAFPINLCINEIAAHYTPSLHDETKANGLLKVDIGVHINGYIADTAFSIDLENSKENKKLIEASQTALDNALKIIKKDIQLGQIGKMIHDSIVDLGFSPIRNLCGHELGEYIIHAGCTIPNYDNGNPTSLEEGTYAIEPFATSGVGIVQDGKPSGIYRFQQRKAIRDNLARQIMDYIEKEYKTLPFSQRAIEKKFGSRALMSLRLMEQAEILHNYPQLVEKSHAPVSQAEHTLIINGKVEVTTR